MNYEETLTACDIVTNITQVTMTARLSTTHRVSTFVAIAVMGVFLIGATVVVYAPQEAADPSAFWYDMGKLLAAIGSVAGGMKWFMSWLDKREERNMDFLKEMQKESNDLIKSFMDRSVKKE